MDKVTHFHIPAEDMERAKEFYRDIFGWDFQDTGMDREYTLATTVETDENQMPIEPGAINGAIFLKERTDESPSVVINVDDIHASIEKIKNGGGTVLQPAEPVEDFGLFAEVADTEGNVIGLWQDIM